MITNNILRYHGSNPIIYNDIFKYFGLRILNGLGISGILPQSKLHILPEI